MMENYTVPSQNGNQIPVKAHMRDSLSTLDIVWANKFQGTNISPDEANEKESEFYKGAPPQWLNFYWAEQVRSRFVRRDMHKELQRKIDESNQKSWSLTHIDLFHQPGSGGSTLAMQILWDLRKKLRCAKVIDSATDTKVVAKQVLHLFDVGGLENQNTVLLLLDNKCTSDDTTFEKNLEENLINEMKSKNVSAKVPVVIILNCIRQLTETKVTLCTKLSEKEQQMFKQKHAEIIQRHGSRHIHFHAFNIMSGNFEPSSVAKICEILHPIKKKSRPLKAQLLAYLSLVNSYAPGSYLTLDICRRFLDKKGRGPGNVSLETKMQPFTNILVIFSTKEGENRSEDKHVRMAHPMIAEECLRLLISDGVTLSDITRNLLMDLCRDSMPLYLEKVIHKILTKRGKKKDGDKNGDKSESQEKFSKLIQDIKNSEKKVMCISVLKEATKKFPKDPITPQALARFYYIEMTDYTRAKYWAKTAIERDEDNSFIRDTLGQVHKNHLKNLIRGGKCPLSQILQIGQQAAKAFKDEADVAIKEQSPDTKDHGVTSTSVSFNNRGFYGYMEFAKMIFSYLTQRNPEWSKVLKKEISPDCFFNRFKVRKCGKYAALLRSLRDEVEEKFEFFEQYLTFSKPSVYKDEPSYFQPQVENCYTTYVTQSVQQKPTDAKVLQKLKEKKLSTFAGLLNALNRDTDLELITAQHRHLYLASKGDADAVQKYILANIILSQSNATFEVHRPLGELRSILKKLWDEQQERRSPEFYLLVLMLFWPDGEHFEDNSLDISKCVKYMHQSFEHQYQNYLRSRYLVPLFLLSREEGAQKFLSTSQLEKTSIDLITKGEEMTEIPNLHHVQGLVRCYKVFAVYGSLEIEVSPQSPASVRRQGQVSFYLGFNIKGPVAYNIRYVK